MSGSALPPRSTIRTPLAPPEHPLPALRAKARSRRPIFPEKVGRFFVRAHAARAFFPPRGGRTWRGMSDAPEEISEADIEALEREAPLLTRLRRFAAGLDQVPWFSALGEPPARAVARSAEAYLAGLGFPDVDLAILPEWEDAAAAMETMDWASPAWEAEELARADLTARALEAMSEEALSLGLAFVAEQAGAAARDGAEEAASIFDVEGETMLNLAVGAAAQACHQAALALLVAGIDPDFDVDAHPFAAKYALFQQGRWPVGVVGASFNVF